MRFENKLSLCLYSEVLHSHRHQCFRFGPVSARMRQTDKTFSIRMYHTAFSSHFGCTYRLTVGKISMRVCVCVLVCVYVRICRYDWDNSKRESMCAELLLFHVPIYIFMVFVSKVCVVDFS